MCFTRNRNLQYIDQIGNKMADQDAQQKKVESKIMKFNNVEYKIDDLSDIAKGQLDGLQVAESKIKHLNAELALIQTARNAYLQALQAALPEEN